MLHTPCGFPVCGHEHRIDNAYDCPPFDATVHVHAHAIVTADDSSSSISTSNPVATAAAAATGSVRWVDLHR